MSMDREQELLLPVFRVSDSSLGMSSYDNIIISVAGVPSCSPALLLSNEVTRAGNLFVTL